MKFLSFLPFRFFTLLFLFTLAFGMPLGKIFMSISIIGLSATWLIEGKFEEKFKQLKEQNYSPLFAIGLFFIPVVWLFNTTDFQTAFRQIELSLPLLALPIVIGTSLHINRKIASYLLITFIAGAFLSSLISLFIYFKIISIDKDLSNVRNISIFMSHIRLSLLICMAIVISIYIGLKKHGVQRFIYFILAFWFIGFLILLKAATAWVILVSLLLFTPIYLSFLTKKIGYSFISFIILISIVFFIKITYNSYHYIRPSEFDEPEKKSINGEIYVHDLNSTLSENGYLIYRYIAPNEINRNWQKYSQTPIDSSDNKGQPIRYTLYRYLTSKGLRKDSVGLASLSTEDIKAIERGSTSAIKQNPIISRLYETFYDIDEIRRGKLEQGHTLVQRIAYLIVGKEVVKDHLWLGTGTGDVKQAYQEKYKLFFTNFEPKKQLKAHNQFLSLIIQYGMIGFLLWIFLWITSIVKAPHKHQLYLFFVIIVLISFLSDNTLYRQAGITFFAFFNALFLYFPKNNLERN